MKDEFDIDLPLVRALVSEQFPEFASLPIRPVWSTGTDNAMFRLGHDACVRLPRRRSSFAAIEKEAIVLPRLQRLPIRTPRLLGRGAESKRFPGPWLVLSWIDGDTPSTPAFGSTPTIVVELADFLRSLHACPIDGFPLPGPHNHDRGCPLIDRDGPTRAAIHALQSLYPSADLLAIWERSLGEGGAAGSNVLVHGDLHIGNMLLSGELALSGIIDFGLSAAGDPAVDYMIAWSLLNAPARNAFRDSIEPSDACWWRAKGWALSVASIALEYYSEDQHFLHKLSRRTLEGVLKDD